MNGAVGMRKKEMKLVITFHTTADAMAMEKACQEHGAPCGMAWCAPLSERERLLGVMKERGIEEEDLHECLV